MKRIKKLFIIALLTGISLLFILNTASSQETAGQLFEKALYLEEGKGELQQAIELYQQILDQYPADREIAAKSLLHLGICYEKLGLKQARETYQDVINKYPDRKGEVVLAKERLSRLLALQDVPHKPTFRKIRIPTEFSWDMHLSPDGQYLTYIKVNHKADNPWQLTIQDTKTGKERELADNLLQARSPCWSPDGKSILVVGTDRDKYHTKGYKGDIYKVDVKSGQTTEILPLSDYKYNTPADDSFPLSDIEWSADGKSIFYLFFKDRLVKHNLETGDEKILYKHSDFERGVLSRSPDGKSLLFAIKPPGEKKSHLFTLPVEGGKEKELCTSQEYDGFGWGFWSPDGKYIYFTEGLVLEETNLWRISAEGGIPQKIWHSKDRTEIFSIHPDGKQIAMAIRERTTEIRVIENLVQELEKLDNISK